jgi:hypothetical protein
MVSGKQLCSWYSVTAQPERVDNGFDIGHMGVFTLDIIGWDICHKIGDFDKAVSSFTIHGSTEKFRN